MLLVDTSGNAGGVAVAELPQAGSAMPRLVSGQRLPGRETQERLMSVIADAVRESGLRPKDLDVLAVVTGPGSFTGVRIGMAAVKGLAESLEKPVVAISRLAMLAAQAETSGAVQAWIDAGRGDVFVGRYRQGQCISEAMMRGPGAVSGVVSGDAIVAMEAGFTALHPDVQLVAEPDISRVLPLASAAVFSLTFADAALLDANYLRIPDAELHRRSAAKATSDRQATTLV